MKKFFAKSGPKSERFSDVLITPILHPSEGAERVGTIVSLVAVAIEAGASVLAFMYRSGRQTIGEARLLSSKILVKIS